MTTGESTSEVDRYLDTLFDGLAGTGSAGRRALAEIDDHLRAAVADGTTRGMTESDAEHEAVARFGHPNDIARDLRRAHRLPLLPALLSSAWLLAGLALAAGAVAFLGTAVDRWSRDGNSMVVSCHDGVCHASAQLPSLVANAGLLTAVGVVLLVGRAVARCRAGLPVSARWSPAVAAAGSAVLGSALFSGTLWRGPQFELNQVVVGGAGPGIYFTVIAAATMAFGVLASILWAVLARRRPRWVDALRQRRSAPA